MIRAIKYSINKIINFSNEIIISIRARMGNSAINSGIHTLNNLIIARATLKGSANEHIISIIHRNKFKSGKKNL